MFQSNNPSKNHETLSTLHLAALTPNAKNETVRVLAVACLSISEILIVAADPNVLPIRTALETKLARIINVEIHVQESVDLTQNVGLVITRRRASV